MNKQRRKKLESLAEQIRVVKDELEELRDEEQTAHDNLPDSFQEGEQGSRMESCIENLDEAIDDLDNAILMIEEA